MKNVIVTGASGFVGSFIVEECLKKGYRTFAGIRKTSSKKYLTEKNTQIIYLNLNDKEELKNQILEIIKYTGKIHYIIHNAGVTKVKKITDFYKNNYNTTKNLIEAILELKIELEKFIYVSSLAVYGCGNKQTLEPIKITDTPLPNTEYGKSKLKAEEFIKSKIEIPWLIFRPTGIYGPRDVDYFVYFKTIQNGFEPYIGFKTQYLTFIYVKDLVKLLTDALESNIVHKSYFVSDGNTYTSEDFANIVKNILNKKTIRFRVPLWIVKIIVVILETIYKPFGKTPVLNTDKYNILSTTNWKCDISETINDFNFVPQYNLEKGIYETIQWYKKQGWLK